LPRVKEEENRMAVYDYLGRLVKRLPLHELDNSLSLQVEKTLRRLRVVLMKIDNSLHSYLNNRKNGNDGNNHSGSGLIEKLKGK